MNGPLVHFNPFRGFGRYIHYGLLHFFTFYLDFSAPYCGPGHLPPLAPSTIDAQLNWPKMWTEWPVFSKADYSIPGISLTDRTVYFFLFIFFPNRAKKCLSHAPRAHSSITVRFRLPKCLI